jgi:uridine kinase
MHLIKIRFDDGEMAEYPAGTPANEVLKKNYSPEGLPYIACMVNNEVCSLSFPLNVDCHIKFITANNSYGMRVYRTGLAFLLAMAVNRVFPGARLIVEHSLGTAFYCSFEYVNQPRRKISKHDINCIEKEMRELVERDVKIERRKLAFCDALELFEASGQVDKAELLRTLNPPRIVTYWCEGFSDLAHGPMIQNTGVLKHFKLLHYPPGIVLQFPDHTAPKRITSFKDQPHLFKIFHEHKEWGKILGVNTVGKLNKMIVERTVEEFVKIQEACHEKKIACIADSITGKVDTKVILIAGPSSSGKTTFAKRLSIQLRVNGLHPQTISLDNYYVNDKDTPRDAAGNPDYEHIKAIDVALFNHHLLALIRGKEVELPFFNFITKRREFRGEKVQLDEKGILVIEGIHGLNPAFTYKIPDRNKFPIYISALTQLNVDYNNRISTTDNRLLRRLVRDYAYRKNSPITTLKMWHSVRRGEKKWIFPFQRRAMATFNSALDYEMSVLKPLAAPLLLTVKPSDIEYAEARRLQIFLAPFLAIDSELVPSTSILREFIGKSAFKY